MLLTHGDLFAPLDLRFRIFAKIPQGDMRNRLLTMANQNAPPNGLPPAPLTVDRLKELALEESPVARLIVDTDGILRHANQQVRVLFSLNVKDVGRPFRDLEISYRPVELRALIEQAYAERRVVTQTGVERRFASGEVQHFDVVVAPLTDEANQSIGVGITFFDVTRYSALQQELQHSKEEVQTANEELQSSNEELETTNEELQSSNEELETTNEELQSTNEELETMNEELQSTNEELQTVNSELRERTDELNQTNSFLESVFASLRSGAVVVDSNLNIEVWNDRAADLWGLRADEVHGKSLLNLDIGLPIARMRDAVRACIGGSSQAEEAVLEATTRRGKAIRCRVSIRPLAGQGPRKGAILLMDEIEA
jgi:two-component system CheB/CheR fusion protein